VAARCVQTLEGHTESVYMSRGAKWWPHRERVENQSDQGVGCGVGALHDDAGRAHKSGVVYRDAE